LHRPWRWSQVPCPLSASLKAKAGEDSCLLRQSFSEASQAGTLKNASQLCVAKSYTARREEAASGCVDTFAWRGL